MTKHAWRAKKVSTRPLLVEPLNGCLLWKNQTPTDEFRFRAYFGKANMFSRCLNIVARTNKKLIVLYLVHI